MMLLKPIGTKKDDFARTFPCKKWLLLAFFTVSILYAVAQAPVAQFTANQTSGCSPFTVQFTDQSTGSPSFWNWDLGNGQLSTLQNPVATYTTPGTYTVTLVVRNASGINSITKTNFIVVNPSPSASFTANNRIACLPAVVQFTDQSVPNVGSIVSWLWDFGDGTTSTQQNPVKTYNTVGFYTVSLTVRSSTGCQSNVSIGNYIRVVSGVSADFSFTPPATCAAPFLVNFTDLTSGPGTITYQWDFGNSTASTQKNPIATYSAPGTYTVQLTSTSEFGCSGTTQKTLTIPNTTTSFNMPDSVCLNSLINFQNNSTPTPVSSVWDFGNGKGSTKLSDTTRYTSPGNYSVKLRNTYTNCVDSSIRTIVVRPDPVVDFSAPNVSSCRAPFTVNFQDISPDATSWQWDFGDGNSSTQRNPTHQYNTEGQFTVTLTITDSKGCRNTISKAAFVRIVRPTVSVVNAPAGGCVGFTYSPIANVNAIDGVASYFWDFGDGNTSTAPNPSNMYSAVGNYTLKLVITTTGGCRDSVVYVNGIRVGTTPNTNFSASPRDVCPADTVRFVVDPATTADQWIWDFGDGGTSDRKDTFHLYSDTGYFTIRLTAINNGCAQTATRNLYVHVRPPIASFTYQVNCNNKRAVAFTNTSKTDLAYGPVTYAWDFGDGNTSIVANPTHTYAAIGAYTVRLTVTNAGCTNSYSEIVNLSNDIAQFSISDDTVCRNQSFTLTATNSSPANIASYQWSYDGGAYQNLGPVVSTSFSSTGPHTISLVITDNNGCTDTITKTAVVTVVGPTAGFSASGSGACRNSAITFNDLSTPTNIVQWTFDFGDGTVQNFSGPPFQHSYSDTGVFIVRLTVRDNVGCTDTYTLPSLVWITRPTAKFSAERTTICPGANLQFRDSSLGSGLSYVWTFGDGGGSTLQNPTHVYGGADSIYTVKLVIRDTVGCTDSATRLNYITARVPKPAFDIRDTTGICPPLETRFTFRGQDYESFYWDFGDGSTSTITNPRHFYNNYGNFIPKLVLVGFGGCLDSAQSQVNVYNPVSSANLTYSPLTACNTLLVDFTITTPPSTKFIFNAGDGFIDSSQTKSLQHLYRTFGYYSPIIALIDSQKCLVYVSGSDQIRVIGAEPLFGVDKKAFCDTGTVLFANYSIGNDVIVSSAWDFGDGNTSGLSDPSHRYSGPGTYFPSLTVTTQSGCTKTLSDTIRVYRTPSPSISGDSIVCINELLPLSGLLAQPDTAISFTWNFGNGSSSNQQNPTTSYSSAGSFTITLETANKLGCKSNSSKNILVPPLPVINVLGNPTIPVGTGINLPVTYGPNIVTYNWSPPRNLSCLDCPVPFANPKSTTKYKVDVTDIYGCTSSGEVTVVVVCNEQNFFIPNTFSPNNDGNNDLFYPRGSGITRIQSMRIFNRWGELVFERRNFAANDPAMGWNGMHKGKKAETDAYVYVIELVCENSVIIPYKGNVTLIR